jgi:hypothetical protein
MVAVAIDIGVTVLAPFGSSGPAIGLGLIAFGLLGVGTATVASERRLDYGPLHRRMSIGAVACVGAAALIQLLVVVWLPGQVERAVGPWDPYWSPIRLRWLMIVAVAAGAAASLLVWTALYLTTYGLAYDKDVRLLNAAFLVSFLLTIGSSVAAFWTATEAIKQLSPSNPSSVYSLASAQATIGCIFIFVLPGHLLWLGALLGVSASVVEEERDLLLGGPDAEEEEDAKPASSNGEAQGAPPQPAEEGRARPPPES